MPKEVPMLVIASKVKEQIKTHGDVNVAGDLTEALTKEVDNMLKKAVERCLGNNRKTVRAADL